MITFWTAFSHASSNKAGLVEDPLVSSETDAVDFSTVLAESEPDLLTESLNASDQEPEDESAPDQPQLQDLTDGEILEPSIEEAGLPLGHAAESDLSLAGGSMGSGPDLVPASNDPSNVVAKRHSQNDIPSPLSPTVAQPRDADRASPVLAPMSGPPQQLIKPLEPPATSAPVVASQLAQPLGAGAKMPPSASYEDLPNDMAKGPDILPAIPMYRPAVAAVVTAAPLAVESSRVERTDTVVEDPDIRPIELPLSAPIESRIPAALIPRSEETEMQPVRLQTVVQPQPQRAAVEVRAAELPQTAPTHEASELNQNSGRPEFANRTVFEVSDTVTPPISQVLRGGVEAFVPARAAPPTPSQTQLQPSVPEQIAAAVLQKSDSITELVLSPKELGRIQMVVSSLETGLVLQITGERPETLELVRRHISDLAQELKSVGYEDVAFEFSGEQSGQDGLPSGKQRMQENTADTEMILVPARATKMNPIAGLDIRV